MRYAPTYLANVVAFIFLAAQMFGLDIPYTSEQVEGAATIILVLVVQAFTAARQLWTGRSTVLGTKRA